MPHCIPYFEVKFMSWYKVIIYVVEALNIWKTLQFIIKLVPPKSKAREPNLTQLGAASSQKMTERKISGLEQS